MINNGTGIAKSDGYFVIQSVYRPPQTSSSFSLDGLLGADGDISMQSQCQADSYRGADVQIGSHAVAHGMIGQTLVRGVSKNAHRSPES